MTFLRVVLGLALGALGLAAVLMVVFDVMPAIGEPARTTFAFALILALLALVAIVVVVVAFRKVMGSKPSDGDDEA
jgi:hypothetical protein